MGLSHTTLNGRKLRLTEVDDNSYLLYSEEAWN